MDEPLIFYTDCDYIDNEEYDYCIQCYRYGICKKAHENEQSEMMI